MMDTLSSLLSTENGALAALVAFAWKYLTGSKRQNIEARVKEATTAAWKHALTLTGLSSVGLYTVASSRAYSLLARLGIPKTSDLAKLVDHELEVLAIEHTYAQLPDLIDPERLFREAEERGKAAAAARREHFDTESPTPPAAPP